jgi:hypothetical protein
MMRHSVAWYKKAISEVQGVVYIEVQRPQPGCVDLYVAISNESNNEQVISEFLRYVDTPELDFFDLKVYFLKLLKVVDIGRNCIRQS